MLPPSVITKLIADNQLNQTTFIIIECLGDQWLAQWYGPMDGPKDQLN
jgi:hypothetical protein